MLRVFAAFVLAMALSGGVSARVLAPTTPVEAPASAYSTTQGGVSLERATQMAVSRFPGRVVRAETTSRNGRRVHNVRVLGEDGRVRNVRIDAQTGQFL